MLQLSGEVLGISDTLKAFAALETKIAASVLDDVVNHGAVQAEKVLKAAIQATGAVETKALLKSIGKKKKKYKRGRIVTGIVGARVGYKRDVTRRFTKRGKQRISTKRTKAPDTPQTEVRDPAKYIHLADQGRKAVRAKTGQLPIRLKSGLLMFRRHVKAAKGHGFMAKAHAQLAGTVQSAMLARLKTGVEQAISQSAAKGPPKKG